MPKTTEIQYLERTSRTLSTSCCTITETGDTFNVEDLVVDVDKPIYETIGTMEIEREALSKDGGEDDFSYLRDVPMGDGFEFLDNFKLSEERKTDAYFFKTLIDGSVEWVVQTIFKFYFVFHAKFVLSSAFLCLEERVVIKSEKPTPPI